MHLLWKGNPGQVIAAQPLSQVSHWTLGKLCFLTSRAKYGRFFVQNYPIWSLFWDNFVGGRSTQKALISQETRASIRRG